MSLEIITLLVLVLVVVLLVLLARFISSNLQKDRELSRARDERTFKLVREAWGMILRIEETAQVITKTQDYLDEKVDKLARIIEEHNTTVNEHLGAFTALAKSEMLATRRNELVMATELKVALERIMGVALTSRQPVAPNDVIAMENLTKRITDLETILGEGQ